MSQDIVCICNNDSDEDNRPVLTCEECCQIFHPECIGLNDEIFSILDDEDTPFYCANCLPLLVKKEDENKENLDPEDPTKPAYETKELVEAMSDYVAHINNMELREDEDNEEIENRVTNYRL